MMSKKKVSKKVIPVIPKKGSIRITVQREDRLKAITELAIANRNLAEALCVQPIIRIEHCNFQGDGNAPAMNIDAPGIDVERTEIVEDYKI